MKVCLQCGYLFSFEEWTCPSCGHKPEILNGIMAHAPQLAHAGGGFRSEYFSQLFRLEVENFWFRARNELILWALQNYKTDAKSFLEVGCGTGFVLSAVARVFPDIVLSGSEIFLDGISHAVQRVPSASFMQMDARCIPYVDEFDAIGAFDVLEHIKEDGAVLEQFYRAIKPGGFLLITVPQHPWLWSASDEYACHVRRYTRAEIEQKVLTAGFELVRSTSFVTSLLPAMIISRSRRKRFTKKNDPTRELKINPFLNIIFYGLLRLEIMGIQIGFNYPVGGSRLIVAFKQ